MASEMIHDRGRGPEIKGTRVTVYNLLPHFLDAGETEDYIARVYELTPEQIAAARAYVLNNPEEVLAEHLKIEERIAQGNPNEVIERAQKTHATFLSFKKWLAERDSAEEGHQNTEENAEGPPNGSKAFPTFRQWMAERQMRPAEGDRHDRVDWQPQ